MIFFFKHKTAYDVRISSWSSDVCSSDLQTVQAGAIECEFLHAEMAVWRHRTEGINHRPERFQLLEHLLQTATRDERFDHFVRHMLHHAERIAMIDLLAQLCFLQEPVRCHEAYILLYASKTGSCRSMTERRDR